MDEGSQCEFSTMSCSTDGAVLKMDARAIIPSESFGTYLKRWSTSLQKTVYGIRW